MATLKILYVDDNLDTGLSRFLDNYKGDICNFDYSDIKFNPDEGYGGLINNPEVRNANIIFIDSKLFENRSTTGKFTGEEFKIILKKYFPFIEVVVITQNPIKDDYKTISKYDSRSGITPDEYYRKEIPPLLDQAVRSILEFRKIAFEMEQDTKWEKVLIEKIVNSLNGQGTFDELTKNDIDEVIKVFQELQEIIDG